MTSQYSYASEITYPVYSDRPSLHEYDMAHSWEVLFSPVRDRGLEQAGWDNEYQFNGDIEWVETDVFAFYGLRGAEYDIFASSDEDPGELRLYDDYGDVIAFDQGGSYGTDEIVGFTAPYSGWYYISADWKSSGWFGADDMVSLSVFEDLDPGSGAISEADFEDAMTVARLYNAAFDRLPDIQGLNYWIDQYDGGMALVEMAANFYSSAEFHTLYGHPSNGEYVDQLYFNVLGRNADSAGFDFWVTELETGLSRSAALAYFSESEENIQNTSDTLAGLTVTDQGVWIF